MGRVEKQGDRADDAIIFRRERLGPDRAYPVGGHEIPARGPSRIRRRIGGDDSLAREHGEAAGGLFRREAVDILDQRRRKTGRRHDPYCCSLFIQDPH